MLVVCTLQHQQVEQKKMNNRVILRIVGFGVLSILAIMGLQAFWLIKSYRTNYQEFTEKTLYALNNVAREFEKLGTPVPDYDIVKQPASNYFVVNVNDEINANNLRHFLLREFNKVGLNEDFEYGIYDCATNQMIHHDLLSFSPNNELTDPEDNPLLIYDEYTYYFGIRFPNRSFEILSTMTASIVLSGILLVTILFFLFSLRIILRQKRLSELQKDFINNMTHEFKTPISTSEIAAQVFLDDQSVQKNPRLNQYAHILKSQINRLNDQVERVLQIAQVGQQGMKLNIKEINFTQMLEEIAADNRQEIQKLGGQLDLVIPNSAVLIKADAIHLKNAIYSLLDNAKKYSQEEPKIELGILQKGDHNTFYIEDNGVGIPSEYQDQVFDKFFRVPTGDLHNVKGFGLGLFYVKNICALHGWNIKLSSNPPNGTRISIKLK